MSERLAIGIIPGTGLQTTEIQDAARAAKDAGLEAIFCTEVKNDSAATTRATGFATQIVKLAPG